MEIKLKDKTNSEFDNARIGRIQCSLMHINPA